MRRRSTLRAHTRRRGLVAALGALVVAMLAAGTSAPAQTTCPGIEYPPPPPGAVSFPHNLPIGVHHKVRLSFSGPTDLAALVPKSARFEIDGPGGHITLPASGLAAIFTPPAAGHYTISARWTQYLCADASAQTFAHGSTPGVPLDVAGERGVTKLVHRITIRQVRDRSGAFVPETDLTAGPVCPVGTVASDAPFTETVYYEQGTRRPTRASAHLVAVWHCARDVGNKPLPPRGIARATGPGFTVAAFDNGVFVGVTKPATLSVLVTLTSSGAPVATFRAQFHPTASGERVTFG